jgi:HEXXH motif-containing protein
VIAGSRGVVVPADPHLDAPGWHGLRDLTAIAGGKTVQLTIDDLDPYRMPAANGLGARLEAHEVETWQSTFRAAWALLVRHHWTTADEIGAAIRVLTPLAWSPSGQLSASSRETFGCVALSAPPDGRTFAVTLAHEVQHAKLAALLDLVRLTRRDDETRYYAPWRDDPRPLGGLLQGAYAYVGVTGFWRRQRHHENGDGALHAHTEFARWRAAVDMAIETLTASEQLTSTGKSFVAGMAGTLRSWCDEPVPVAALTIAHRKTERHRARWRLRNGELSGPHANCL